MDVSHHDLRNFVDLLNHLRRGNLYDLLLGLSLHVLMVLKVDDLRRVFYFVLTTSDLVRWTRFTNVLGRWPVDLLSCMFWIHMHSGWMMFLRYMPHLWPTIVLSI